MYLGILEADTIKQEMNEKNKKRVPQKNEEPSRNQALQQKFQQRDTYLISLQCKKLSTIFKMDKGRTQTNRPKDKKAVHNFTSESFYR